MNRTNTRIKILSAFVLAVFLLYTGILFHKQAVQPQRNENVDTATVATYRVPVASARGEILDRNGRPLVQNRQGTDIVLYYVNFPQEPIDRNNILISLIRIAEMNKDEWIDTLPLVFSENGTIVYEEDREADIAFMKSESLLHLNTYATAQNCFDAFVRDFELKDFSIEEQRKLASVYFNMAKTSFGYLTSYTFAKDISKETAAYIMENNDFFKGVETVVTAYREYSGDGTLASHILGVVGSISAEEYKSEKEALEEALKDETLTELEIAQRKARAYSQTSEYGKFGIEAAAEQYLHGANGTLTFRVDADDSITKDYSVLPQQGYTVISTLHAGLQEVAEQSLQERIQAATKEEALAQGLSPAGAVAVLDIHTGAVLASASYPDFSLNTYYDDYGKLLKDDGKPLWNRTTQSTYAPGSTMKCAVALAALEEGIIDENDTILCQGTYEFYDITFACHNQTAHGYVNVKTALEHSCNIFFYQLAEKLGIEKIQEYARLFGLGSKTGIEINESAGILAGPAYRDSIGATWQQGETLLAAIGQSDNSFSIMQLASYVAMIANGGTRYTPYLIDKVLSSDYSEVLYSHETQIAAQPGFSQANLNAVKEGMRLVATETTASYSFYDLEHTVAAKTGTAEKTLLVDGVYVEGTDGFLITFGPYEDPQIAIAIVVENAGSGSSTAQVAADIYEYYFETQKEINYSKPVNELIG